MDVTHTQRFVSDVLPVVRDYARRAFGSCSAELRDEYVAEALAAAFVSFVSLVKRRRTAKATPSNLAYFAVKHVKSGRKVGGSPRASDALTPRIGVSVTRFGHVSDLPQALHAALADNTRSPVSEQVAFRIDFADFLGRQPARKEVVAVLLAQGHRPRDVATTVGLTPGRVTQIRHELRKKWMAFAE